MEAIKNLNQEFKPTTEPENKNNIIINPFEGYKSYNKYYKASVIYNTEFIRPQLIIMKSYNTEVEIYNRSNGFLILNMDYYNSSKTTKEQLNFFTFKYIPAFKQGIIYLDSQAFQNLINIFYDSDVGLYENKEYNIIRRWKAQKSLIDTITTPYLTADQKTQDITFQEVTTETQELKTRFKIIEHCNTCGVKFDIIKTWKGNPQNCKYREQDHIKTEIKLKSETSLYRDARTWNDKKLYTGWDMGRPNCKSDYI